MAKKIKAYLHIVPCTNPNSAYSHFEVQSIGQTWCNSQTDGECEPILADMDREEFEEFYGRLFYTIFGRLKTGHREAIGDFDTVKRAEKILRHLNGDDPEDKVPPEFAL